MIDHRFSRDAFESLGTRRERDDRARELAHEILALVGEVPSADSALSAVLVRLRLIGHHLYPRGDGVFGGDDTQGAEEPTGLVVHFQRHTVDVSYNHRR